MPNTTCYSIICVNESVTNRESYEAGAEDGASGHALLLGCGPQREVARQPGAEHAVAVHLH